MSEIDRPSFVKSDIKATDERGEALYTYTFSTTPLLDPFSASYRKSEAKKIATSLEAAQPHVGAVYGNHASEVEELLAISCDYALLQRLSKAHDERNDYIARLLFDDHDDTENGRKWANYSRIDQMFAAGTGRPEIVEGYAMHLAFFEAICRPMERIRDPLSALSYLKDNRMLRSVELANMTHPLIWDAPDPMADAVNQALRQVLPTSTVIDGSYPMDIDIRRFRAVPEGIYAIARAKQVHAYDDETGIGVLRRSNYVINLCHAGIGVGEFTMEHELTRKVIMKALRTGTKLSELPEGKKVSDIFSEMLRLDPLYRPRWLEPSVTSFYAARDSRLLNDK